MSAEPELALAPRLRVLVRAADPARRDALLKLVREGGWGGLFDAARFMAEYDGNPDERLMAADDGVVSIHYSSPTEHHCSEAWVLPDGVIYCRRRVAGLDYIRRGAPSQLVGGFPVDLYLVGMALGEVNPDSLVLRELQREFVAIRFRE